MVIKVNKARPWCPPEIYRLPRSRCYEMNHCDDSQRAAATPLSQKTRQLRNKRVSSVC